MLKNLILVTLRKLYREKSYAAINIVGMSIAVACSLILIIYIKSELTYDMHFRDYDKIVRVGNTFTANGQTNSFALTSFALGPLVKNAYPNAGEFVRFTPPRDIVMSYGEVQGTWSDVMLAEDNVFDVFEHDILYGDPKAALIEPHSIAISETMAKFYFGDNNPIGEELKDQGNSHRVTLVFKDLPENTHLKYSALISRNHLKASEHDIAPNKLFGVNTFTYFKLSKDISKSDFDRLLEEYHQQHIKKISDEYETQMEILTHYLKDIHFRSSLRFDSPTGNILYVYGFSAVAIFILLIACINYTNLAIAQANKRAREIGMRKVIGASRVQLASHFIVESVIFVILSIAIGLSLIELAEAFSSINQIIGKKNILSYVNNATAILSLVSFTIILGIGAGFYPAYYLSSISPLSALTVLRRGRTGNFQLRSLLVFIQFFVSVAVVACTCIMVLQVRYVGNKYLGFDKENQLNILLVGMDSLKNLDTIKHELLQSTDIKSVTYSTNSPKELPYINIFQTESSSGAEETITAYNYRVGEDYLSTMGMRLISGRDFSDETLTDTEGAVLVNEALVDQMGWDDPLGKRIGRDSDRVIGVIRDFHYGSLRNSIEPLLLRKYQYRFLDDIPVSEQPFVSMNLIVKISNNEPQKTITFIDGVVSQFQPKQPFTYSFTDEDIMDRYQTEQNLMQLTGVFSVICIFISCLGLLGLSSYTTDQRRKEIGVHRVLGASMSQIIIMLSKHQLLLVVIAAILACFTSYFVMSEWLQQFAYRTEVPLWVFFLSTLLVTLVAQFTLSLVVGRASIKNPIDSLRFE